MRKIENVYLIMTATVYVVREKGQKSVIKFYTVRHTFIKALVISL